MGIDKDKLGKVFKIPSVNEKDSLINLKKVKYFGEKEDFNDSQKEGAVDLVDEFLKRIKKCKCR